MSDTRIQPIYNLTKWILYSTYVKDVKRPLSLIIICEAEHGKSYTLDFFEKVERFKFLSDLTAHGLLAEGGLDSVRDKQTTHLVCPDFNPVVNRKSTTVGSTIALLNFLIWDGLKEIVHFAIKKLPKGYLGLRCGMIISITKDVYFGCPIIRQSGFMSRFIPLSFSLTSDFKNEIKEVVKHKKDNITSENFVFPNAPVSVHLPFEDKVFNDRFDKLAQYIGKNSVTGIRAVSMLMLLLQGVALSHNKRKVSEKHLEEIEEMSYFLNIDSNQYPKNYSEGFK